MTRKTIKRQIEKFNAELQECYNRTGDELLYWVDTTIEGETTYIPMIQYTEHKGYIEVVTDNDTYRIDDDCSEYDINTEMFKDDMRFYRRMIRKTLRVWEAENPDAELEKEDEE